VLAGAWPDDDLERVETCPICDSSPRTLLYNDLWDASFLAAPGRWSLWRCGQCRSAYLDPRPTAASIGRAYERYYTHRNIDAPETPKGVPALVKRALGNGYRNGRYGAHTQPATRLGLFVGMLVPALRRSIDYQYRYLPRLGRSGRVLDVGCGGGDWLVQAAAAGWQACGVEPDPVSVQRATDRGLEVRAGSIAAWSDSDDRFDAVTMNHVIEHVDDPRSVLKAVFDLLLPGGRLYIDTPNIDAATHASFGRDWRGLETPRHLVLFSRRALDDLLAEVGFVSIIHRRPPSPAEFLVRESERMLALDPDSKPSQPQAPTLPPSETTEFLTLTCERPRTP